jgi:hypothetical protein
MIFWVLMVLSTAALTTTVAFSPSSSGCYFAGNSAMTRYAASLSRHQEEAASPEKLQDDIAELKELAAHRLDALMEQMEDLKRMNEIHEQKRSQDVRLADTLSLSEFHREPDDVDAEHQHAQFSSLTMASTTSVQGNETQVAVSVPATKPLATIPLTLLDDTAWKIVFNIGRESGTWMPKDWAASGDRLLFQCTVRFAATHVNENSYDEFFQSNAETKQLIVSDAFVIPRGVGDKSVGRRPLPVQSIGAYKVCRGHGPYGTDIVRLYIELAEDVAVPDHKSDVYCPSGRIYATCGYFANTLKHDPAAPSTRDRIQQKYNEALHEYEHLQSQVETDNRGLFNMDHLKMMKDSWTAKKDMERLAVKLQEARQREPERAQLRLNKAQTVGLTREGGVCCKVHKGLALEYHILGRIEVGYVDDHQYYETSHQL